VAPRDEELRDLTGGGLVHCGCTSQTIQERFSTSLPFRGIVSLHRGGRISKAARALSKAPVSTSHM
jgi:hypothetical protein